MYLQRDLTHVFHSVCNLFPAVLITGPRQSGKSTFLLNVLKDHKYLTFDDPLNREFALTDPNGFLDQFGPSPVVLDEIQYVPEILQYIKIRIDQDRKPGQWILTGSQQFHLMKNISETLAGRIAILELAPFCFSEIKSSLQVSLANIIWTGMFPEPACFPEKRDIWLSSYIQTYIERDVRQLDAIKNFRAFELFVRLSAAFHSQEFQAARLARECGVSQPTIKSWSRILEAGYVGIMLPPFYKNYGKRLVKSSKFYFLDPAIVCYLTRQPSMEAALSGNMGGALFEGLIVSEVFKAFYNAGKKPSAYYWRSHGGLEIDLIIESKGKLWPVEIKMTSTPTARHTKNLVRFKKLTDNTANSGIIVCRINQKTTLPGDNIALPWTDFPEYLKTLME